MQSFCKGLCSQSWRACEGTADRDARMPPRMPGQIYKTDQRNLFSKYADKRTKAIAEIKAAVAAAK